MKRPPAALLLAGALLLLSGCGTELAYNTVRAAGEQACYQQPPPERERCLEKVYKGDYETYKKERP